MWYNKECWRAASFSNFSWFKCNKWPLRCIEFNFDDIRFQKNHRAITVDRLRSNFNPKIKIIDAWNERWFFFLRNRSFFNLNYFFDENLFIFLFKMRCIYDAFCVGASTSICTKINCYWHQILNLKFFSDQKLSNFLLVFYRIQICLPKHHEKWIKIHVNFSFRISL